MAKKKKKKGGKLPYVHIDVLPEEDANQAGHPEDASAEQGGGPHGAGRPEREEGPSSGRPAQNPGYEQYPAEVISASESGLSKQPLEGQDDDDDEIIPFVIPVFRKSDAPQSAHEAPQGNHPGFGNGPIPPMGQGAGPQQDLAQIQNNLLMQHNLAQQQAGAQAAGQPAGRNGGNLQNGRQPGQGFPAQQGASATQPMCQQAQQRQGNPRQSMQQPMRQQPAAQAAQPSQQRQDNGMQGASPQASPYRNGSQGQAAAFAQQGQPMNGHAANGHAASQAAAGNGRARQNTGQFAPVGAQPAQNVANRQAAGMHPQPHGGGASSRNGMGSHNGMPPRNGAQAQNGMPAQSGMTPRGAMGAQAGPSPSATGGMTAVAAAAAARSEQARMHSAFGSVQAKAASRQMPYSQGPRQAVQQPNPAQAQQPMGQRPQGRQPQGTVPQQTRPGSSGAFAAVSSPGPQPTPQPTPQPQSQPSPAPKPADASTSGKIGDPLLDSKAIEDSPMFDKPPVSIEEGMRKSVSGRKVRRRVIVIVLLVLLLAGGGAAAYMVLSQQGVVPQISIETKTVPVTPQGSSSQSSSSSAAASSSDASSAPAGTGSGDLSGTVVYQYSANTASGVEYKVEETVSFQANGDCQSSTMSMTFPDAASAKTFTDNLARDYGSSFKLDSLNGENAVVTIDNSGLHLSRDEYENALRYSVVDLVVLGK